MEDAGSLTHEAPMLQRQPTSLPLWWANAPDNVKQLFAMVRQWYDRAEEQKMQSVHDMGVAHVLRGQFSTFTNLYYSLFSAVEYADSFYAKDNAAYTELTSLIKDGTTGLIIFTLSQEGRDKSKSMITSVPTLSE